jgi:glycosyltransferase involved in cell wall biosynthesis
MAQVGVVHDDLRGKGGAEAVSANILDMLQKEHQVTLFTNYSPNIKSINEFFELSIDPAKIEIQLPDSYLGSCIQLTSRSTGIYFNDLQVALLQNSVNKRSSKFDVIINTKHENEYDDTNTINYIHFPYISTYMGQLPDYFPEEERKRKFDKFHLIPYKLLCNTLSGRDYNLSNGNIHLANSFWTSSIVDRFYKTNSTVLYPPINTEYNQKEWSKRENGFLAIGSISKEKNQLQLIEIIDQLRERGNNLHIHIIGTESSAQEDYVKQVKKKSANREYVKYEGPIPRNELDKLLESHKYGLHGKSSEHFGIAVGEMVSAGLITYVPASGGQTEIVRNNPHLIYSDTMDAVEKISRVHNSTKKRMEIISEMDDQADLFGKDQFRSGIHTAMKISINR